jgi:hypothetical protein
VLLGTENPVACLFYGLSSSPVFFYGLPSSPVFRLYASMASVVEKTWLRCRVFLEVLTTSTLGRAVRGCFSVVSLSAIAARELWHNLFFFLFTQFLTLTICPIWTFGRVCHKVAHRSTQVARRLPTCTWKRSGPWIIRRLYDVQGQKKSLSDCRAKLRATAKNDSD